MPPPPTGTLRGEDHQADQARNPRVFRDRSVSNDHRRDIRRSSGPLRDSVRSMWRIRIALGPGSRIAGGCCMRGPRSDGTCRLRVCPVHVAPSMAPDPFRGVAQRSRLLVGCPSPRAGLARYRRRAHRRVEQSARQPADTARPGPARRSRAWLDGPTAGQSASWAPRSRLPPQSNHRRRRSQNSATSMAHHQPFFNSCASITRMSLGPRRYVSL